jgi:hypothetical protein
MSIEKTSVTKDTVNAQLKKVDKKQALFFERSSYHCAPDAASIPF